MGEGAMNEWLDGEFVTLREGEVGLLFYASFISKL